MNAAVDSDAREAARCIREGGVIVYPTETVYGIGCDPWNRAAVERVLAMKGRRGDNPMLLLASSRRMVEERFGALDALAGALASAFWPGPLTLVIRPAAECPEYLYGPSGGIAVRVTSHEAVAAMAEAFGGPIVSTSANLSGHPPVLSFEDARALFGGAADMVLDSREPCTGVPSTVVDTLSGTPVCVREGAVPFSLILEAAGR
jgi:L-threonylcarbamoyladenylate synthase